MTRATLTQAEIARAAKVVKAERVAMTITTIDGTIYRLMPVAGEALWSGAKPRPRLIFEMCLGTGQRIGDVLRMRWSDIDGAGINVKQGKTGAKLWVPFTPALAAILDDTPRVGMTICAWGRGKPTSYRGAADLIHAVRVEIGAERWDIHSLRYNAASELGAAGCSDELIQSVTGHQTSAMVVKYAGPERQKARAKEAQGLRK